MHYTLSFLLYSLYFFALWIPLWILGGAIVFGLYYLLYKRAIKKNMPITNASFIIKAPLIIGCSNILLFIFIFLYIVSQPMAFPIILLLYSLLAIPVFIASIAISIVFYKKQLISIKRLGLVVLINIICIILFYMLFYTGFMAMM